MKQRDMKDVRTIKESIDHAIEVVDYSMFSVPREVAEKKLRRWAIDIIRWTLVQAAVDASERNLPANQVALAVTKRIAELSAEFNSLTTNGQIRH